MAQAPRYDRPTAPVAFRAPEEVRRILDYLVVATDAASVSDYLRALLESHLADIGFTLVDGVHRALPRPPTRAEIEQWEVSSGSEPR